MPGLKSNKPRLYLAIYSTPDPNHLAFTFIVAPKTESNDPRVLDATKYRCRRNITNTSPASSMTQTISLTNGSQPLKWLVEKLAVNVATDPELLVRVCLGKLDNQRALEHALSKVPVSQNDPDFTPEWWMQMAWSQIQHEQILSKESKWTWATIQTTTSRYLQEKTKAERLSTQKRAVQPAPVYDMISKKELIA
ncbi:hypothetical protein EV356DRAFT_534883 [Viridothelium virens]|uniref:Uncharacterized protein n=1 Tax=Viridothelium virens TaxID=1048519 RepID=A0A6A6H2W0_VIRVR|nr:hypothetical protein EV356DRAFT_534883 [Viridothelium virens]